MCADHLSISVSFIPLLALLCVQISVSTDRVVELTERLLGLEGVRLAGLGARDILRLEAGLCLYGNDISEETTPIEAGLAWCISTFPDIIRE